MIVAFLAKTPFYDRIIKGDAEGGLYNGYVAFDKELPLSLQGGASWDDEHALDNIVSVHGGITLDIPHWEIPNNDYAVPIIPLTAIPSPEEFYKLRVIGFDTLHCDDTKEKWNFETVKEETLDLMTQLENI